MIRSYLRASTQDQDASRAKQQLIDFAAEHGHKIAATYTENASGADANRNELQRLLADASAGDILLVESVDRLTRLSVADWQALRAEIDNKQLRIVACDLPTSHAAMKQSSGDEFTSRMLDAINRMMVDLCAAIARKDFEQRKARQKQGIQKAKAEGRYRGRQIDQKKHQRILATLAKGCSIREAAAIVGCSTATVQKAKQMQA
jgi:DNA invertase Pin-like site-specific DNA recombinase